MKLQISLFMEDVKTPEDDILFLFFFFFFRKPRTLLQKNVCYPNQTRWNDRDEVRNNADCLLE